MYKSGQEVEYTITGVVYTNGIITGIDSASGLFQIDNKHWVSEKQIRPRPVTIHEVPELRDMSVMLRNECSGYASEGDEYVANLGLEDD